MVGVVRSKKKTENLKVGYFQIWRLSRGLMAKDDFKSFFVENLSMNIYHTKGGSTDPNDP